MDTLPPCTPALAAQTRGPVLLGVAFGLWSLALIAVILRFWSRYMARANLWWDDWTILLALALSAAYSFSTIPLYLHGVGKHTSCADPDAIPFWLKTLLAWEFLYTLILVTVKYSILLFLWRLFTIQSFRKFFWIMWAIVTSWGIGVIVTSALSCRPLHAFWGEGTGKCINTKNFFVGNSVPNIATDVGLLVLPIPWLLRLQMPKVLRFSLIGVFVCGAMVVVISSYRLYILLSTSMGPDLVYNDVPEATWTIAEMNVAIFCACLPSMSPILKKAITTAFAGISFTETKGLSGDSSRRTDPKMGESVRNSSQMTDTTTVDRTNDVIEMHKAWSVRRETNPDSAEQGQGTYRTEIGMA